MKSALQHLKTAYVTGASEPGVSTHQLNYNPKSYYEQVHRYHEEKSVEHKTPWSTALLTGGAIGAGVGGLYGALAGGAGGGGLRDAGAGALVGAVGGGVLGMGFGAVAKSTDDSEIEASKAYMKLPKRYQREHLRQNAISHLEYADEAREDRQESRHQEMMREMRRNRNAQDHYPYSW